METFNGEMDKIFIDNEFKYIIFEQIVKLFCDTDIVDIFCENNVILLKKGKKYGLFRKNELNQLFGIDEKIVDSRFCLDKKPNNILFLNGKIVYEISKDGFIKMESID